MFDLDWFRVLYLTLKLFFLKKWIRIKKAKKHFQTESFFLSPKSFNFEAAFESATSSSRRLQPLYFTLLVGLNSEAN